MARGLAAAALLLAACSRDASPKVVADLAAEALSADRETPVGLWLLGRLEAEPQTAAKLTPEQRENLRALDYLQ